MYKKCYYCYRVYLKWLVNNKKSRQTILSTTCHTLLTAGLSHPATCQEHFSTLDSCTIASQIQQMDEHIEENVRTKDEKVEEVMDIQRGKRKGDEQEQAIPQRIQPATVSRWNLRGETNGKAAFCFHTWPLLWQRMKAFALFSELISTAAVCNLVQHGPGETGLDAPALMTHVASCNIHNQACLQPKSTNNITE